MVAERLKRGDRVKTRTDVRGSFGLTVPAGTRGIITADHGDAGFTKRQIVSIRFVGFITFYALVEEVENA